MTQSTVSIATISRAAALAALYNAAQPQGMGFLHYDPRPMTVNEAEEFVTAGNLYFDYLKGRVMKVDLSKDNFDPRLYDRDNGEGAAQRAIDAVTSSGDVNDPAIAKTHAINTEKSATVASEAVASQKSSQTTSTGIAVFTLGLEDVAAQLKPAIDRAVAGLKT